MSEQGGSPAEPTQANLTCASLGLLRTGARRNVIVSAVPFRKIERLPRILDLLGALKADLVCMFIDREHSAQVPMVAAENVLENPTQDVHKILHSL